jgi:hypothetical protein
MHNLAADPQHGARLGAMREKLENWMKAQGDTRSVFNKPRLLSDPASTQPGGAPTAKTPKGLPAPPR